MKNYYETLEVDIYASDEMIERAYKLLAKRYHPDTQPQEKKEWAEEEFKKINEAYETLSNEENRKSYTSQLILEKDHELNSLYFKKETLEEQVRDLQMELQLWKNNHNNTHANTTNTNSSNTNTTNAYTTQEANTNNYEESSFRDSYQTYYQPQQNSYTNPEPEYYEQYYHPIKHKLKNVLAFLLTLAFLIGILFIIWQIPFIRNSLMDLYNNNGIIQSIVDIFIGIFG